MKRAWVLAIGSVALTVAVLGTPRSTRAQGAQPIARIAEIEVDPQQLEAYKAALREGIEAAMRLEPGVLSLSAVSVQGHPEQVRVFEVYASREAYQAHLQTAHFRRYKAVTQGMVRSLKLVETEPILLGIRR